MTPDEHGLDNDRMLILSLKPRFVEAILTGDKTVELRRIKPRIYISIQAILYATTPVCAVIGSCIVTSITSCNLSVLWEEYGSRTALDYQEFQQYFQGLDTGTALILAQPQQFNRKIPLHDLRSGTNGFRPPQSYSYIDAMTGKKLMQAQSSSGCN